MSRLEALKSFRWLTRSLLMQSCEFYMNCITRADPNRELLFTLHLASYFLAGTNLMASVRMKKQQKMTKCVYNASTDSSWCLSRLPAQASAIFGVLTCLAQVNFMVFNDYIFNDYLRLCAGAVSVKQIDVVTIPTHRLPKHSNKSRHKTLRLCTNSPISISVRSIKLTTFNLRSHLPKDRWVSRATVVSRFCVTLQPPHH